MRTLGKGSVAGTQSSFRQSLSLAMALARILSLLAVARTASLVLPRAPLPPHLQPAVLSAQHRRTLSPLLSTTSSPEQAEPVSEPPAQQGNDQLVTAISGDGSISAKAIVTTELVAETSRLQGLGGLAAAALGRALTCTLLVADGLKDDETFQVNFRGDGPLRGVLAIANGALEAVRAPSDHRTR